MRMDADLGADEQAEVWPGQERRKKEGEPQLRKYISGSLLDGNRLRHAVPW